MSGMNRVCAKIDLDAIESNLEHMKDNLQEGTQIMAVIKADGYGHGAVPIAHLLEPKDYVWGFAVATVEEAKSLRDEGIEKPILILGVVFPDQWAKVLEMDVRLTIYTEETARQISDLAGQLHMTAPVHIKLDTGMSRLGFPVNEDTRETILRISQLPNLKIEGLYTHFAKADEADKTFTNQQLTAYLDMKNQLEAEGLSVPLCHVSNSAGIIDVPEANLDLVRAGISLYGLYPSEEVNKEAVPLQPALSLYSHVAHVKWVDAGTPVSYGGTFVTDKKTRIATIPVGYGDGYPRSLSNKGYVLIHGERAPILGRVCMDQFMVDVTDIPDVQFLDLVTLIGTDGGETLRVETLSDLSGRFNYEFVCDLGKRIPREYLYHGSVIGETDFLPFLPVKH